MQRKPRRAGCTASPCASTVVSADTGPLLTLVGTIEPRYRTDLSFRVFGRVITRTLMWEIWCARDSALRRSIRRR